MELDFLGLSLNLRGRQILECVSGAFRQGQVTVILGANGAGKSILLSCLAGLRTPDRGQIKLGGRSLAVFDRRGRARMIGLLSQRAVIHWDVAVATLVGLRRLPHPGRCNRTPAEQAATAPAVVATDSTPLATRTAQPRSGGVQGSVPLARVRTGGRQA